MPETTRYSPSEFAGAVMLQARDGEYVRFDDYTALLTRAEAAEARAYTLAVAIMGGEDAPGHADSIDTGILADQLRKERADQSAWIDACVKVGREAAEAERDEWKQAYRLVCNDLLIAVKALGECQQELDQYSQNEYPSDHPLHVRYRKRDYDSNPARAALTQLTRPIPDPRIEGWNAAIEAVAEIYGKPFHSGGVAKSMAHFVRVDDHRKYQEACTAYRDAIRSIPCPYTPKEGKDDG